MSGGGDVDAEVFHTVKIRFCDCRFGQDIAAVDGVVECLAGVEEWERFGVDRLACCEDRVVEKLDLAGCKGFPLGCDMLEAAERTLVGRFEENLVDGEANFWWQ